MKKTLFLLILCTTCLFGNKQQTRLEVVYSSKSAYLFAYLKIGGTFVGRIYRGKSRTFHIHPNKLFSINIYRANILRERELLLKPGEHKQVTLTLSFEKQIRTPQSQKAIIAVRLASNSKYDYAHININREYFGIIRKSQTRRFLLQPGIIKITLYRTENRIIRRIKITPGSKKLLKFSL